MGGVSLISAIDLAEVLEKFKTRNDCAKMESIRSHGDLMSARLMPEFIDVKKCVEKHRPVLHKKNL